MANDLTAKQKAFIREYLLCRNGTQAAIKAKYSKRSAEVEASRLLTNAKVRAEIDKHEQKEIKKYQATKDNLIDLLAGIAFLDPHDILEDKGKGEYGFKKLSDMPPQARMSLEIFGTMRKKNPYVTLKSISKDKAIELLSKHLGLENAAGSGSSEETRRNAIKRIQEHLGRHSKDRDSGSK